MSITSAKQAAEHILKSYWLEQGVPVDCFAIAKRMGIVVRSVSTDNVDIAGGIYVEKGERAIIFHNQDDSQTRARFTVAHELGHYCLNSDRKKFEYLEYRSNLSATGTEDNMHERWANSFAANLLMPEQQVRQFMKKKKNLPDLASIFRVSSEAMSYRLAGLEITID